jgi:Holliday junction resolvasome RuvABC ATP-dependent DNA helicase subunit
VSVLERVCTADECIQCWAEQVLSIPIDRMEVLLEEEIRAQPMMNFVGQPTDAEMAVMRRSGRRETRLFAHLVLMEPHECGKVSG